MLSQTNRQLRAKTRLANGKLGTLRGGLAAPVQRPQIINSRLHGVRQPDPQRSVGSRRNNGGDRICQLLTAVLVDDDYLGPDHQVPVDRRDYPVFYFDEVDD